MTQYLNLIQIAICALLITSILLQARGTGLTSVFGGEGNVYRTKRGAEKFLFFSTIVLSAAFMGIALLSIILAR